MLFKRYFFFTLILIAPSLLQARPGYYEPWGKDTDLQYPVDAPEITVVNKASLPVRIADQIIRFHQNVLSPVDGPRSHFVPTSSHYMQLAMRKHGFIEGFFMGCDRLIRENNSDWVYRTIEVEGKIWKYDPVPD